MSDGLATERSDGVLTLAIDRPQSRNALSRPLLEAIEAALTEAAADDSVRVIVLRGRDASPFSSGFDVGALGQREIDTAEARRLQEPIRTVAGRLVESAKPVIGAAQGFVYGAALDVFAHCDIRVAAAGTRFVMPPARHGFSYPAEGLARIVALIGLSRAAELVLLGDPIGGDQMLGWGFLHRAWPDPAFEDELRELARRIAGLAPRSLSSLKTLLSTLAPQPTAAQADEGYSLLAACLNSEDAREGLAALREKRPAQFSGR